MDASFILFLGAGKCNVVVDLPMCFVSSSLSSSSAHLTGAATQRAALRIRNAGLKECPECYRALGAYAGGRQVVPLSADLYAAIASVVPAKFHTLMKDASEATLVPNFTSDPAQLLRIGVTAPEEAGRVADYTVEVKPKSAWQPPHIVGIVVDGAAHWIEETKHRHCRYAQMLCYKRIRDSAEEAPASVAAAGLHGGASSAKGGSAPYCPNYLFRPNLSSRDGLQRLMHSPQNNLRVISYHASRKVNHPGNPETLTVEELNGIADAIDASGVLVPLAHLQLYGCAPANADALPEEIQSRSVPVLDAQLLHHWSVAQNKKDVQWIVVDVDSETLCSCTSFTDGEAYKRLSCANPRYVVPSLDYAACLDRFYVSTTAKDVSLMIAVSCRRSESEESVNDYSVLTDVPPEVGGGCFVRHSHDVYRVGVVDLDVKTHKALEYYHTHDKNITNAFMRHNNKKRGA
ncbi:Inositol-pentakisphosphate 2-kinase, putative [Leishmania lindenbergi]|uniref:Inositol-pentakisphosphate 2-kinase n=1 Tax=Leishmania lindenbergi TaxID=651832 RepID=A0AAW3AL75_9TRYP